MNSLCFDQQNYKNLLPVSKAHLFMKKITRIQAIDRQMRKNWIKIKRNNDIKDLSITKNYNFSPCKEPQVKNQNQINFKPSKDHSKVNSLHSSMKREQILNNHKKHQEVFYGSKNKNRYQTSLTKQSSSKDFSRGPLNSVFDSPRRRIKTQIQRRFNDIGQKDSPNKEQIAIKRGHDKIAQDILANDQSSKGSIKLPHMLLRRQVHRSRQNNILGCQSLKELVQLSMKSRQNTKVWQSRRKNLLHRLKGSHAYYIMKNPTRLEETQNIYFS